MPFMLQIEPLTHKEKLQLELYGIHSMAQRDDRTHLAEIAADVEARWPAMGAWIKLERARIERRTA